MALIGQGVLIIWHAMTPEGDLEMIRWHDREHVAERVGIPGFRRGRRYDTPAGTREYLDIYETDSAETVRSAPYILRLNFPTEWTKRVLPHFRNTVRLGCETVLTTGRGQGGALLTLRARPAPGRADVVERWLRETLPAALLDETGVVGVHLLQTVPATTQVKTNEGKLKGGEVGQGEEPWPWVLLVETGGHRVRRGRRGPPLQAGGPRGARRGSRRGPRPAPTPALDGRGVAPARADTSAVSLITGVGAAFVQSVLPVLLIGGLGYLVGRARTLDLAPITGLTVLVLVPAIVFDSLARATLPRDLLTRLVLHVALQMAAIWVVTVLVARLAGWRGPDQGGLLLATLFSNSGNVGLPLALFAFGPDGLAVAGGWFAVMSIGSSTVGPYLAARARLGVRGALGRVMRQPIIYAVAAGVIVNLGGFSLPGPVANASRLLAGGAVALMLLLLGLQLARLTAREEASGAALATVIRLVAVPPIAWGVGRLVGLEGMAFAVAVIQASTPTSISSALWALEFDARPALVSAAVVLSTVVSVVTLTVLLAVLTGR